MDTTKRRRYDSTLDFNDEIPKSFDKEKHNFYEFFGPVFERNAYWSKRTPVPTLGDDTTDISKVLKFYQFWDNFDSWREFTHEEEYDIEQAESRYEKRYMERENRRMKSHLYKKEKTRISTLATLAYDNDPRIQKMLQDKEEERLKAKEAKRMAKEQKRLEEQERRQKYKEEAERKQKEEEDKIKKAKELKLKQKQENMQLQNDIKVNFLEKLKKGKFDEFYIEGIFEKLKKENLTDLAEKLRSGVFTTAEEFDRKVQDFIELNKLKNQETYNKLETKEQQQDRQWTNDELSLLSKTLIKFPPGTTNRWTKVSTSLGGGFSEQQIAEKAKELKENPINKPKEEKGTYKIETSTPIVKDDKWTQAQQKQLENAIKSVPNTLPPKERWTKIAEYIEGKTMEDCVKRFKEIKEKMGKTKK